MTTQEINGYKIQANVFCRHNTLRDWFFYRTEFTISQILLDAEDHYDELDMVFEDLLDYTDGLLEILVELELYELCSKVQTQTNKLAAECSKALSGTSKIKQTRLW
tara:strand:- start:77 stop:394 length:318 start_codon:yes stop_codon:yes gene_type:complete